MQKKEYSLFTAITMIVGTVIGSGIFFKSDNILVFTQGSIVTVSYTHLTLPTT